MCGNKEREVRSYWCSCEPNKGFFMYKTYDNYIYQVILIARLW